MEIVLPYILASKTTDEIHIWFTPRNEEDARWIESEVPKMSEKIKIIKVSDNPFPPNDFRCFSAFYAQDCEEDSVYLRLDDDLVWMSENAIDQIFDFRIQHPEYFLVSPTIINNILTYFMHKDKISFSEEEISRLENECYNYHSEKDCYWFTKPNFAIQAHEMIFKNIDCIDKLHTETRVFPTKYSINAISFFGMDMKTISPFYEWDEPYLSYTVPKNLKLNNCVMGNTFISHYSFGPQFPEVDKTDILDKYRLLYRNKGNLKKTNTAVLFICHIINDETKFRYNLLKKGCQEMGYDLFWAVDTMAISEDDLPKNSGIDFYPISFLVYEKLFPYMTFIEDENRMDWKKWHNTPFLAYHLFVNDNPNKYDRIWLFEYDVCCYGEWTSFFKKYENESASLICSQTTYTEGNRILNGWCGKRLTPYLRALSYNGCLSWSLLCACRVDTSLHQKVCEFFQKLPEDDNSRHRLHMEIAWPTIARLTDMKIATFQSNQFENNKVTYNFNDYSLGTIYHPIKMDIEWKKILERIPLK